MSISSYDDILPLTMIVIGALVFSSASNHVRNVRAARGSDANVGTELEELSRVGKK